MRRGSRFRGTAVMCGVAGAVIACTAPGPDTVRTLESELTIRRLLAVWESADTVELLELFAPSAIYDDFANQTTYQGLDEIVGYVTDVHRWGDGVFMNVIRVHAHETGATAEWVFSATHARPMGERVPVVTGRDIVLNGVTVIELERGRIVRAADYMDTAPLALQLGGSIELPGGTSLTLEGGR